MFTLIFNVFNVFNFLKICKCVFTLFWAHTPETILFNNFSYFSFLLIMNIIVNYIYICVCVCVYIYIYMPSFIWSLDPLRMMQGCTIRRCQHSWHSQMCFKNLRTQIFWVIHAALLLNFSLEVLLNFNCDSQLEGRKVCYGLSPAEECIRIFGKVFFRCLPS